VAVFLLQNAGEYGSGGGAGDLGLEVEGASRRDAGHGDAVGIGHTHRAAEGGDLEASGAGQGKRGGGIGEDLEAESFDAVAGGAVNAAAALFEDEAITVDATQGTGVQEHANTGAEAKLGGNGGGFDPAAFEEGGISANGGAIKAETALGEGDADGGIGGDAGGENPGEQERADKL